MKNYIYFVPTPKTAEELKAMYRKLAMEHHPDRGGKLEAMKQVNAEYDELFPKLKDIHQTREGETYRKETTETAEHFKSLIDELMRMDDIVIEVIGCFVWVTGNTKPHKEQLKTLNFKWHTKKIAWYLAPEDYKKRSRKDYGLDEIPETTAKGAAVSPAKRTGNPHASMDSRFSSRVRGVNPLGLGEHYRNKSVSNTG